MRNQEIAKIFYNIAKYLQMDGVEFKPYAYEKAGNSLEALEKDVGEIYNKGGLKALMEIPGVGKNISDHIEEYLKSGKIKVYEQLKKKLPLNIDELVRVEGMGPRKVKILYQKLGIKNLKVFGKLKKLKEVQEISFAGSLRRKKETIGDCDILVVSKEPKKVMDFFVSLPDIEKVWGKGGTKASVHMKDGFDMDLRVVPRESYGSALQYFTGSKEHNIITRKIAIDKGLKLSEYGLFKGKKMIAGDSEEGIYRALGLAWIPPEMRENQGEIELAEARPPQKLPDIMGYQDVKGDLHIHSDWDGGDNSIEDLAKTAQKIGYEYIGIADHTKALHIEHGLNEDQLERRNKEIDKL